MYKVKENVNQRQKSKWLFQKWWSFFSCCCNVLLSLKFILNHYWNNYFNSGRYFNSGCDVKLSLKFILNHYWNNYFNSGRYFNSGCDVKLSLKFILNHYWNNYFNSGRYFNSGCNNAAIFLSCDFNIAVISSIRTPSAYEVFSQRKWPGSYEWFNIFFSKEVLKCGHLKKNSIFDTECFIVSKLITLPI